MKKYFYSILAAGMLFATSCSETELVDVTKGEGQTVTYTVEIPGTESRAIKVNDEEVTVGAGQLANRLIYAMYENGSDEVLVTGFADRRKDNGTFTVEVTMAKDITYDLLFMAYNPDNCAFVIDNDEASENNLRAMAINSDLKANMEQYDAFVGQKLNQGINGDNDVELFRPFAQVNAATTETELGVVETLNAKVTSSKFVIYGAPTTLDIYDNSVTGTTDHTYAKYDILKCADTTKEYPNEDITVNNESYKYLAMAYVLAGKTSANYNADFEFYREDDKVVSSVSVVNMPIQANYRTNVTGNLLTQQETYTITVDAGFETETHNAAPKVVVNNIEDLQEAIEEAEDGVNTPVELGEAISLTEATENNEVSVVLSRSSESAAITIPAGKVITINLNGFTISQEKKCSASYSMIDNKGKLTIVDRSENGEGRLSFKDTGDGDPNFGWGSYTISNHGELIVEGGTIEHLGQHNEGDGTNVHMYCAIQQSSGAVSTTINGGKISTPTYRSVRVNYGILNINDGVFEGQVWMQPSDANTGITINGGSFEPKSGDGSSVFVENNEKDVKLSVTGGFFNTKIGCSDATKLAGSITGGTFTQTAKENTNAKLLAEGCIFEEDGENYIVKQAWITDGEKVTVASTEGLIAAIKSGYSNISLADGDYTMPIGSDVSLNGKTLSITGTRNVIIDAAKVDEKDQYVAGATLAFEGVTLNFGTANYMGFANYASLTYKNCAINGLQFAYGAGQTVFENCDLNSNGAEHCLWTWGGENISFTDCHFTYGDRAVNCYGENVTTNVSFTNCTFTKVDGEETTGAIETNSSALTALTLTINNCTVNEGHLWWISTWDSKDGANTSTTVDGKIASSAAMLAAITNGATEVELLSGNYTMPIGTDVSLAGKTLTIKGTKDAIIDVSKVDERDQYVTGATLAFEGVTLNFGTALYMGFANTTSLTYTDCVINGVQHLYGPEINFEGCTLNVSGDNYMVRTWGGKNVKFDGCNFNCDGKALLVYNQSCNLTVNKCTFNDNGDDTITDKAAIEVCNGDSGDNCVTHNIVIKETKVNGFAVNPNGISTNSTLWANKNSLDDAHLNVTIDGKVVY